MKKYFRGFSLLEVSFVLIIFGVLAFGGIKGWELVKKARLIRVANDLRAYANAVELFKMKYSVYPDVHHSTNSGNEHENYGDTYNDEINTLFWRNLGESDVISLNINEIPLRSSVGGYYYFFYDKNKYKKYIVVGDKKTQTDHECDLYPFKPVLSIYQAKILSSYLAGVKFEFKNAGAQYGMCMRANQFVDDSSVEHLNRCVLYVEL